jgi:hypothetical protein
MTAGRPTFAATIAALTLTHPDLGRLHTDEEADVAEVLHDVQAHHQGADESDHGGTWGTCTACATPWPCTAWNDADHLGLLYLGRAQDRVAAHARQTLDRLAQQDRERKARPLANALTCAPIEEAPC